jgi:hypothetical protein
MNNLTDFFTSLYQDFNERNIDAVITNMTEDVKWANGMEGGYVYGHAGVRDYWTRQFMFVKSTVIPLKIDAEKNLAKIKVHQVVHDIEGNLLADEIIYHFFHLTNDKIAAFDIGEKEKT